MDIGDWTRRKRQSRAERVQQLREWVEEQIPRWRQRKKLDPCPRPSAEFQKYNKKTKVVVGIADNKIQIFSDPHLSE